MKKYIYILFICFFSLQAAGQWTVETVPDPKADGKGYVSNPDNILTQAETDSINNMIQELEDSSKSQVAVVMLKSIGDVVPKNFATALFNNWGVGDADKNNGLLILFVLDQRRIEFETGYGTEQILTDAECYSIQQDYMIEDFKAENYGVGMVKGIKQVVDVIMERDEQISESTIPATSTENDYSTNYGNNDSDYNYEYYSPAYHFMIFYFKLIGIALALYVLMFVICLFIKDYFVRYQIMRIYRLYFWFILFPVPFLGIYFINKRLTEKWRNTPRISAKTGKRMHKLSEEEDDKYLKSGQISEEKVKSVDYDVWVSGEQGDVLIQSYKRWFSKFNACPKCRYKTYYKVYDKVIISATYNRAGKGERFYKCEHCGHSRKSTYTIPKKTKSSSSKSSSSSWGSSSSSWSSGSSSWSSGSSWGGGSSGGGGAGSSW